MCICPEGFDILGYLCTCKFRELSVILQCKLLSVLGGVKPKESRQIALFSVRGLLNGIAYS